MKRLTPRQSEALSFLVEWDEIAPPTVREVQEGLALPHLNQAVRVIDALVKKRFVRRTPGKARSLEVLREESTFHMELKACTKLHVKNGC